MKNKMSDLRNHLFETIERLKDEEAPMDVARARAISDVAGVLIESVKVEIEFMEATGEIESLEFMDDPRLESRKRQPQSLLRA